MNRRTFTELTRCNYRLSNSLLERFKNLLCSCEDVFFFLKFSYNSCSNTLVTLSIVHFHFLASHTATRVVTCDHTLPPLYLDAVKEGMIHLLVGSYVKKPDSGVFSDWSRNNAYETLRSYWLTYFNLFQHISGQKVETEARF